MCILYISYVVQVLFLSKICKVDTISTRFTLIYKMQFLFNMSVNTIANIYIVFLIGTLLKLITK